MSERMSGRAGSSRDDELTLAFQHYVDRLAAGETIRKEEVWACHPEFAQELIADLETLKGLGTEKSDRAQGEALGEYRILREIGRGGMGVVYEAWDERMERQVALKVLPQSLLGNSKAVARFMKEARIAGKLHHPGIIQVYAIGIAGGCPYFAMEYVEGKSLARALEEIRPSTLSSSTGSSASVAAMRRILKVEEDASGQSAPDPPTPGLRGGGVTSGEESGIDLSYCIHLATLFADMLDALSYAHRRGVVHRDLKPSNLMIDSEGRLRILDFGLARQEGQETLTVSGDLIGTLLYMSPEQAASNRVPVDHRTDIYSLGATLYEALTFQAPFKGRDHRDLLGQIIFTDARPPRRLNPRIPRDLDTIVLKCLEKDPRDRYGTAEALSQDLRRFARGDAIEARPLSFIEGLVRRARRRKGAAAAVVASLLLLVASGFLALDFLEEQQVLRETAYRRMTLEGMLLLELGRSSLPARSGPVSADPGDGGLFHGVAFAMEVDPGDLRRSPALDALERLEDASKLVPEGPEAIYHAARALEKLGRLDHARERIRRITRGSRPFPPAVVWCAARGMTGETAGQALPPARGSWEEPYRDAQVAARERRWKEAEDAYTNLISALLREGEPYLGAMLEARLGRGIVRLELDHHLEAIEDFGAAHGLAPRGSIEPALLLGKAYLELKMTDRAEARFRELLAATPFRDESVERVAGLLLAYQAPDRALEWARRIENGASRLRGEARCLVRLGRRDEAHRAAEEAVRLEPSDDRSHRALAHVLLRRGEGDKAIEELRIAVDLAREDTEAWLELGQAYSHLRRGEEARSAYAEALKLRPQNLDAMLGTAYTWACDGRHNEAERLAREVERIQPRHSAAPNILGVSLGWQGRLDEAILELERARDLDPSSAAPWSNLGWAYHKAKRLDEGAEASKKAIEIDPSNDESHKVLGAIRLRQGLLEDGIRSLEACVSLDPLDNAAHFYLGVAYEKHDEREKAMASYERAIALWPRDPRASYNLGNIHLAERRFEQAVTAYRRVLEHNPDHDFAHNNIALAYTELGKLDDAGNHLAEALRLDPKSAEAYWNLASVREKQTRLAEAIDLQKQGIQFAPSDPRPLPDLSAWLERSGDIEGAIRTRLDEIVLYASASGENQSPPLQEGGTIQGPAASALEHLGRLVVEARKDASGARGDGLARLVQETVGRLPAGEATSSIRARLETLFQEP